MEIIVGKTAGFCFGVSNAVNKTRVALENEKVDCLGELVHNPQVTQKLKSEGLNYINDICKAKNAVIIRSHGESLQTYQKAEEKNIKLIDLTCPKVLNIHNIAKEYSKKNYYIFLIGQKTHAETIGTISYCGKYATVIEQMENIDKAIEELKKTNLNNILIISQTTYSMEMFEKISLLIQEKIEGKAEKIEIKNTICNATKLRQEETKKIAKQVDTMIIIGGRHSSNTKKLYDIATNNCKKAILVETSAELKANNFNTEDKIGIMAGASTPQESIDSVVEFLRNI